ncbi:MAG TPA: alpha/beta hydrolase [Candidatus Saccharimonadales bacterium]|nr:alpha/beta hydrolase [Candidatus Saccharimonadales bacterium]
MTANRRQICVIHGGTAYEHDVAFRRNLANFNPSYERLLYAPSWRSWLAERLPDNDILLPSLPNKQNAKYSDWALYFAKIVPFLLPDAVLIGHSLGGIFLAKYLCEHPPEQPYGKIILIAAPYNDETGESLGDFKLTGASKLARAAREIHLLHSKDDPVVPFAELAKYQADLPQASTHIFDDKQHFNTPTFPELLLLIS